MKDYQFRCNTSYLVPKEVYYQCVWMVRDSERLLWLALSDEVDDSVAAAARRRTDAIESALYAVPEEYRLGIMRHVKDREAFDDYAHENTWKKWQQRFIYELAVNLMLIN